MILLTHPIHGSKFALHESEVALDEENGWVRYTDGTPESPSEAAPVERVKRKYTRRVQEAPVEQPNSDTLVSDESEGV